MSTRASRLLQLIDRLRCSRSPLSGPALAQALGISLRTLYRDIAELRAQGANIKGDPGVGYQLGAGFMLPPLMFDHDELEALVLGARWVRALADTGLSAAAERALGRIASALPASLRIAVDSSSLFVPPRPGGQTAESWLPALRLAIRKEHRLRIDYVDARGEASQRIVWPFAMAFFDPLLCCFAAWCELRGDFRHFRADRIVALQDLGERYPDSRHRLMQRWCHHQMDDQLHPQPAAP